MKAVIISYKLPFVAILKADSNKEGMIALANGLKDISMKVLENASLSTMKCEIVSTHEIEIPDNTETEDIEIGTDLANKTEGTMAESEGQDIQ